MIETIVNEVSGLLGKFIPDKTQREALAHDLATMTQRHAQDIALAQIKVNESESKHQSIFVSGWRPACGWVCVFALFYHYVLIHLLSVFDVFASVPRMDMSDLLIVLGGMLGLSTNRMFEKFKGVANK